MTELLAELLATQIRPLPYVDRCVGLARSFETQVSNGDETQRTVRFPVPVSFTAAQCDTDPRYLLPDAGTASVLFFEDQGTVARDVAPNVKGWESTLRLIGWFNPNELVGQLTENDLLTSLTTALNVDRRIKALGPYTDLLLSATLLPADASLVSRYTIETPMLYPPYRLVGIELKARYRLALRCQPTDLPTLKHPKPVLP